jgi:uncharacterized protein YjiS (DUF1127 family)
MSGFTLIHPLARRRSHAAGWLGWLATMLHAIESRRRLAELDDRMLKDIGLDRLEALREVGRAPWDITTPPRAGNRIRT